MLFALQAGGERVEEFDRLPRFAWHEERYWDMASAVWSEMNSGMGRGMIESLRDYCAVTGVDDVQMIEDYFQVMRMSIPQRKEKTV